MVNHSTFSILYFLKMYNNISDGYLFSKGKRISNYWCLEVNLTILPQNSSFYNYYFSIYNNVSSKCQWKKHNEYSIYSITGLYQFTVLEDTVPGSVIGRLRAHDPDIGENAVMSYSILDGDAGDTFSVMSDSAGQDGILRVQKVIYILPAEL